MTQTLTIGELGKKVNLPTKTIRFYEEIGLIEKPTRAENGYRTYSQSSVEKLLLVKHARDLGLSIEEIKKLMVGCVDGNCEHTKEYIKNEVNSYLITINKKIKQLEELRAQITMLKGRMTDNQKAYCCNILQQIADLPKGGEK